MTEKRFTRVLAGPKMGAFLSIVLLVVIGLTACSGGANPQPAAVTPTLAAQAATQAPTATAVPATATQASTATAVPTETATPAPTATAVPALALAQDGFTAWCMPTDAYTGTLPTSPEAPKTAHVLAVKDTQMQVQIPAAYCVVDFKFNQPAPEGLQAIFYDASSPFLKLSLTAASDHPEEAWAIVRHDYVINPPYWYVTYKVAVDTADGKELWANPVKFSWALPPTCIYTNALPDFKTGWCPISDPWEIEPHPDAKYPYDRSRLLTPQAK